MWRSSRNVEPLEGYSYGLQELQLLLVLSPVYLSVNRISSRQSARLEMPALEDFGSQPSFGLFSNLYIIEQCTT